MRVFFDTEFTGLTDDADLISVGFVSECANKSLYIELSGWDRTKANEFVLETVVPLLERPESSKLTTPQCASTVASWLAEFGQDVELVSDSNPIFPLAPISIGSH